MRGLIQVFVLEISDKKWELLIKTQNTDKKWITTDFDN